MIEDQLRKIIYMKSQWVKCPPIIRYRRGGPCERGSLGEFPQNYFVEQVVGMMVMVLGETF